MEKDTERKRVKLEKEFINCANDQTMSSKPLMSSSPIKSVRSRHNSYRAKSLSQENLSDLETKLTSTSKQYKATLFDYLRSELRRGYLLENDGQRFTEKREKFYIFLTIPKELGKCLRDGFRKSKLLLKSTYSFLFVCNKNKT